jgi:formylglycine-generating enzyme required for sulfatase activity
MCGKGIACALLVVAMAPYQAAAAALSSGRGSAPAAGTRELAPESMIRIPGGKFFLGRQPSKRPPCRPEGHEVTVSDFWIDRTEVTTGEYLACEGAKACPRASRYFPRCNTRKGWKRRNYPINCVSAAAADSFCRWKGKRLPSEAEWERAARGSDGRIFPWGNSDPKDQLCWNPDDDSSKSTCPVGSYPKGASPYGVLDMAGNVAEWTSSKPDWYGKEGNERSRILKGGSYYYDEMELADDCLSLRSDERNDYRASMETSILGFRCARDIDASAPPASKKSATDTGKVTSTADQAVVAATPPRGSPERKELLDAVRARLHTTSEFEVGRLIVAGTWAYFEGREHRPGGAPAAALLQRSAGGNWQVVDVMGEAGTTQTFDSFRERIRNPNAKRHLPDALFR